MALGVVQQWGLQMINRILAKLGLGDGSLYQEIETRRKHIRHEGLLADVVVQDRTFGVKDWSMGGFCFETLPDPHMVVGDKVQFTLRFKLPHETVIIRQAGRIVRAARRGIAAEFMPLSPEARRKFTRVIDSLHAKSFLESQVA
jgi:hypothetical protein